MASPQTNSESSSRVTDPPPAGLDDMGSLSDRASRVLSGATKLLAEVAELSAAAGRAMEVRGHHLPCSYRQACAHYYILLHQRHVTASDIDAVDRLIF